MRAVLAVVVFATALLAVGTAAAGPANDNITTYTATCVGTTGSAEAVRVELSLDASPNSRPGVALHIVGSNQIVLVPDTPGLVARAEEEGTSCTVTHIDGVDIPDFTTPVIFV
jgi:hypothetical protein